MADGLTLALTLTEIEHLLQLHHEVPVVLAHVAARKREGGRVLDERDRARARALTL
jgi:hypothetical protein